MAEIMLSPRSSGLSLKEHALMYAALGWKVFPVHEMSETGCSCSAGTECDRPGKHPRTAGGLNEASNDRVAIETWWTRWPRASIGIATGRASGLTVIDADASDGKPGVINITTISAPHGGLPNTLVSNTGGGGLHLYFQYCQALGTGTNVLAEAIDVRNDGGYVIAPPSIHHTGNRYVWRSDRAELATVPPWALDAANNGGESASGQRQRRRGRPRKHSGFKLERAASMLTAVDANDRDKWLAVGVILGRLYVGSGEENDAWTVYENWAARSEKFDESRAENIARMREMFYERSQEEPRAGGSQLTIGSLINWAREGGWSPFGDRVPVDFQPGNELSMAEQMIEVVVGHEDNKHFNVMGQVRDVLRTAVPITRYIQQNATSGGKAPETLIVRKTSTVGMLAEMMRRTALRSVDKNGAPIVMAITPQLASIALEALSGMFPALAGIAEWPMVGMDGEIIAKPRGYDPSTGLYFEIDEALKIDEKMKPEKAWKLLSEDLMRDFPFENGHAQAAALGLLIAFMQRPLMKTCPAFGVVAPQPGSGKSTLVEVASLAIHGMPITPHPWTFETEELRKALHSLLMTKIPAIMFDNLTRGMAIDSDHMSKLLTSEISADRTLGASETRKELNSLLVTFTGNNISFVRDLASRVISIRLNAQEADPLARSFHHPDIKRYALSKRAQWLSAVMAIAKAGFTHDIPDGANSRFEDFDLFIAKPVHAATGIDIRELLREKSEEDSETEDEARAMLLLLWRWQERWRGVTENGRTWRAADVITSIESNTLDESAVKIIQRGCGDIRVWERDPVRALGYALRSLAGNYRFSPLLLKAQHDTSANTKKWIITGGPVLPPPTTNAAVDNF